MHELNDLHSFASRNELVSHLVQDIVTLLKRGIEERGRASLAVSGGSTPIQLFKALARMDLAWHKVDLSLVDERWVAPTDSDSNEHLLRTYLLKGKASTANFSGMKNSAETAPDGEIECGNQLGPCHPTDVLILGMGDDGHTASLFPKAAKLAEAIDMNSGRLCMGVAPATASHERMTLTLPTILSAKQIFLHITGQKKRDVLEQAYGAGPPEAMPIRFILHQSPSKQKTPLSIYWAK